MKTTPSVQHQEFIAELSSFADQAEKIYERIQGSPAQASREFALYAEWMIAIRGTAEQLGFNDCAKIAGVGEELAVKAQETKSRSHIRKCVAALWDAVTSVKYLIEHTDKETGEEQRILIHRLEKTLEQLGGARPTFSNDEIAKLLSSS